MENVLVIVGPTAVGKTELSIELAKRMDAEIISGDSVQVYRGMDIGSGKIKKEEMNCIPHHMIDIKQPDEPFSVATYQSYVQNCLGEINARGNLPILVGGSGLYIQAVLYNYRFQERKTDKTVRNNLRKRLEIEGKQALYDELKRVDPIHAKKVHPNNDRRVIRALEIYETTGLTVTETAANEEQTPAYNHLLIGLEMDRERLYNQINQRVDQMIQEGLVEEVQTLYEKGYAQCQSMQAIGYKEIIPYLKGETDLESQVSLLKRNSRRYAKRQYTWFKNRMDVNWFPVHGDLDKEKIDEIYVAVQHHFNL